MRFWDSSALLELLTRQTGNSSLNQLNTAYTDIAIWWGTRIEMISGICRLLREAKIGNTLFAQYLAAIDELCNDADEIQPSEAIRQTASRILRMHNLRAADSLQLAAALIWTEHDPTGAEFICLDKRLREAAEKEGFTVLPN